jgi:hypothetical protein
MAARIRKTKVRKRTPQKKRLTPRTAKRKPKKKQKPKRVRARIKKDKPKTRKRTLSQADRTLLAKTLGASGKRGGDKRARALVKGIGVDFTQFLMTAFKPRELRTFVNELGVPKTIELVKYMNLGFFQIKSVLGSTFSGNLVYENKKWLKDAFGKGNLTENQIAREMRQRAKGKKRIK